VLLETPSRVQSQAEVLEMHLDGNLDALNLDMEPRLGSASWCVECHGLRFGESHVEPQASDAPDDHAGAGRRKMDRSVPIALTYRYQGVR
jgi:hypothetical protein